MPAARSNYGGGGFCEIANHCHSFDKQPIGSTLFKLSGQITEEVDFVKLQICWNSDQKTIEVEPLKFVSEFSGCQHSGSDVMIIHIPSNQSGQHCPSYQ